MLLLFLLYCCCCCCVVVVDDVFLWHEPWNTILEFIEAQQSTYNYTYNHIQQHTRATHNLILVDTCLHATIHKQTLIDNPAQPQPPVIDCKSPGHISSGYYIGDSTTHGSIITYRSFSFFTFESSTNSSCLSRILFCLPHVFLSYPRNASLLLPLHAGATPRPQQKEPRRLLSVKTMARGLIRPSSAGVGVVFHSTLPSLLHSTHHAALHPPFHSPLHSSLHSPLQSPLHTSLHF